MKTLAMKVVQSAILGAFIITVTAVFMSTSALAGSHSLQGKTYKMCVTHPEQRCFLVAEMVHNYPYPFFQKMDKGFWASGHWHDYYHRYYLRDGDNYHTFYYYQ